MGPFGSKNFTTLLLLQVVDESFQTFPAFFPNGHHKAMFGIFELLEN